MNHSVTTTPKGTGQVEAAPEAAQEILLPMHALDRTSQFGALIGPLYDKLTALRDKLPDQSIDSITWRLEAFPLLHNAFRDRDLLSITPSLEDQMFTMVDEIADQIRRIYNHEWLAQYIENQAQRFAPTLLEGDLQLVGEIADVLRANGFSQFLGNGAIRGKILEAHPQAGRLVVDSRRVSEITKLLSERSAVLDGVIREIDFTLDRECSERAASLYDIWWDAYTKKQPVITDPDHIWNNLSCDFRSCIVWQMDRNIPYKLDKMVSFMVVEDNPLHQWIFSYILNVTNALLYAPPEAQRQQFNTLIHPFCYQTVVDAEAAIVEAIECGMNLPDVIVSDIELLDTNRNGLDLIESIDQRLKEAGRRGEVQLVMVYSSNLRIYEDRVEELISRGVIDGARTKKDFKLEDLLSPFTTKRD